MSGPAALRKAIEELELSMSITSWGPGDELGSLRELGVLDYLLSE